MPHRSPPEAPLFPSLEEDAARVQAVRDLADLARTIAHHDRLYHQLDAPVLSDADYDALREQYRTLRARFPDLPPPPDDPETRVGAAPAGGFTKATHRVPMLSLANVFTETETREFVARARRFLGKASDESLPMVAEPKIDGLSAALVYENGVLIRAATRGDGTTGEDITAQARGIRSLPARLQGPCPEHVEVRGEIYLSRADFLALNEAQKAAGKDPFANPRNAAAGSVRQLDPTITASRPLGFFAYALVPAPGETLPMATQSALRECLHAWGFTLNEPARLCDTVETLLAYAAEMERERHALPYDTDGLVYKVDSLADQARLGTVSRAPRWATAYKFPPEQATTRLNRIVVQVGRTGVLTPVAELEPVTVGGVVVSRATLHNEDEIARKDIRESDLVRVQRAGDVIPQVVEVFPDRRGPDSRPFALPDRCPACGALAVREPGEVARRCTGGLTCPAQALEGLEHFVSRDALNIEGLGTRRLRELWDLGWIRTPADLFRLESRRDDLKTRDRWGEDSVTKLLAMIEARRRVPLDRFLFALGIRHVGDKTARQLARRYGTLAAWRRAMDEARDETSAAWDDLKALDQMGPDMGRALTAFCADGHHRALLDDLSNLLVVEPAPPPPTGTGHPLAGKTLVFTGTLTGMTRAEAKALAEAVGATLASAVSRATDYVIVGDKPGSTAKRARELNVPCLDETAWEALLEG